RPPPKVTWWRDGNELIGTSHTSVEEGATVMVNQLLIGTTTRDYYGARIECRAQGTRLLQPVTKDVTVQVHLKPIRVKIITPNDLLTAGHPIAIRCESWGSYPAAKIVWLLDGEPIRNAEVTLNNDKEVSAAGSELPQRNETKTGICRTFTTIFFLLFMFDI
ncbi:kin of IRRE-like protein 2, partial [Drosophila navojoa]|uniref:kin of IRRE-like protein 2 n=1 Tax=Drosophila navojoa TaxID=7232 RepID=UPI0011BEFDBD